MNVVYRYGHSGESIMIWQAGTSYNIACIKGDNMVRYVGVSKSYLDKAMHDVGFDDRFISNVLDQI